MSKPIPYNLEAEKAVLGSLLEEREAVLAIASWLKPEHFYFETHRTVYEAVLSCYHQQIPPDLQTVADELRRRGLLERVGGLAGLIALTDAVPTAYHVEHYARPVERTAILRGVIQAGGQIAALGYDEERELDDVLGDVNRIALEVTTRGSTDVDTSIAAAADELLDEWQGGVPPGLKTWLAPLDAKLGGLQAGDLVILAARPGVGKSDLAVNVMMNVGAHDLPVQFFSLEMNRRKIMQRCVALQTGISRDRIKQHEWGDEELLRLVDAAGYIQSLPITIDDRQDVTLATLRARALQQAAKVGRPALVIVDYLQLVRGDHNYRGNRAAEVGDVSRGLKMLARELNCPLLALCQMNREVEQRANHRPSLADLRESGGIEADADTVLFIHREEMYSKSAEKGVAEVIIEKQRQGPRGIVPMYYGDETGRWAPLDLRH